MYVFPRLCLLTLLPPLLAVCPQLVFLSPLVSLILYHLVLILALFSPSLGYLPLLGLLTFIFLPSFLLFLSVSLLAPL